MKVAKGRFRTNKIAPDIEAKARALWMAQDSTLTNLDIEMEFGINWRRFWNRFGKRPEKASRARRLAGLRAVHGHAPQRIARIASAVALGELTILEICREYGISKRSLYDHIPGGRRGLRQRARRAA